MSNADVQVGLYLLIVNDLGELIALFELGTKLNLTFASPIQGLCFVVQQRDFKMKK